MQMRNRTPTAAGSPRVRAPVGAYKDKYGASGGGGFDPKNLAIGALLVVVGFMALKGGSQPAMPAATINPNSVRRAVETPVIPDVVSDAGAQQSKPDPAIVAAAAAAAQAEIAAQAAAGKQKAADDAAAKEKLKVEARQAAQEHHDQDQLNIKQAHEKALEQKGVKGKQGKNGEKPKKLIVKDADGDIVMDDMLAKDIAAGHDVDGGHKEEEETDVAVGENRWHDSKNIPTWLKEYFDWHKKTVADLKKENWREQRYIVMTCLGGEICGNVAHRLRPMMAMLRVAADSKRVFYIHWDLPDRLEKFLHPPQHGGIDWVVPEFVMWKVRKSPHVNDMRAIDQQAFQDDRRVVNVMYNDDTFAEPYYNERRKDGEKAASEAFHDVWNVLFKPSFMLTERIGESLRLMGLKPGEYATAHIDYEQVPKDDHEQEELRLKVENAMNCMSTLRPGGPFLVAAQTYAIAREAIVYGKQHGVKVHAKQIAHDTSTVPTDLFTSFVEIMLMADSRCVAYNRGGYGQLGYILGYDYNCRIQYGKPGTECAWKDPPAATEEHAKHLPSHDDPDK